MAQSRAMPRRLAPLLALLGLIAVPLAAQSPAAGNGTIFVGSYSGHLTAVDEATEKFSKIPLTTGPPFVVRLSPDKTRFYVQSANQERFEVVDVGSRKSVDTFTLSDQRKHVRALAFEVDPLHRTMVIVAKTATKQIDRWEIGDISMQFYDLAEKKVTRSIPWPRGEEREFVNIRFSPDGKLLYFFGDDVLILETANFTEVDTWALSRPIEPAASPSACSVSTKPSGPCTIHGSGA